MTEAAPETQAATAEPAEQQNSNTQGNPEEALADAGKKALDAMKAERNEAKREAAALRKELDEHKQASMTESEKAVAEAEKRGRSTATSESGRELAQARFDAAAARRNPDFDTTQALEYVDLGKFLGEDGKPDTEAIKAAVERLVPESGSYTPPSFDGGSRTTSPAAQGMSQLIRKAAGRA